jgi:hypothetical protein
MPNMCTRDRRRDQEAGQHRRQDTQWAPHRFAPLKALLRVGSCRERRTRGMGERGYDKFNGPTALSDVGSDGQRAT